MSETTSISLIHRICDETDAQAWQRFVGVYRPLLMRWASRFDVQNDDAEDLAQDVMLVVMRELPRFQHNHNPGAFRNWLRTILVNRLREFWRSREYRPAVIGKSDFQQQLDQLAEEHSGISRIWNREHDEFVMKKLMDSVEPQFEPQTWLAFRRQVIEGIRADSVATELGMKLGAVYMAKSRVLSALRRESTGLVDL